MTIQINEKFRSSIPKLSSEEYQQLELNIIADGCRDALVVWRNGADWLLDGHNRYEICQKHGIEFRTELKELADENEALIWIAFNQLGKRNLSSYNRSILALALEALFSERAKRNQLRTAQNRVSQKSVEQRIDTQKELAKTAGVSHDTIAKVKKIEAEATEEQKEKLKSGEESINGIYRQIKKPYITENSGQNEWYTPPEIVEAVRTVLGEIDLDPASSDIANEVVKADDYYTKEDDGLLQEWHGRLFLNPPYAQPLIRKFSDKMCLAWGNGEIDTACVLVNNATETTWFRDMAMRATAICFMNKRIRFLDQNGNSTGAPLQGQAVLFFGENTSLFAKIFRKFGFVLRHV